MLRCPTCLNRVDGGEKRCSACGARLRSRRTAGTLTDDGIATRPRVLVERELQARIEAQTASHFRQRRRAAKAARRIASIPASLYEAGVMIEPENGSWSPLPDTPQSVIDLASTANHEPQPTPQRVGPPEPLALVAPVLDITGGEPRVEPVVDAPEPEPVPEPDPKPRRRLAARFEERWQLWKASRDTDEATADAFLADAETTAPSVAPDAEPEVEPVRPVEPAKVEAPKPQPAKVQAPKPQPAKVDTPKPQPANVAPAARITETVAHSSRGAAEWQPSTSLWANRVFNSKAAPAEVASWPPKRKPAPPSDARKSARVE